MASEGGQEGEMSSESRKSQRAGARNPLLMPLEPLNQQWFLLPNRCPRMVLGYCQPGRKTTETKVF